MYPRHKEVPGLGVKSELQLPAYATAPAMPDSNRTCDLHCSSQQCWILNPPSKIRDQTLVIKDISQVLNPLSHNRNSHGDLFLRAIIHILVALLLKQSQIWPLGAPPSWSLCPVSCPQGSFQIFPYFLASRDVPGLPYMYPAPDLGLVIFSGDLRRRELLTKI